MPRIEDIRIPAGGPWATRVTSTWRGVQRQPSWIVRATATVFLLVMAIPIIALVLLAVAAAFVVFLGLTVVHRIRAAFGRLGPRDDGRENVRVIERRPEG